MAEANTTPILDDKLSASSASLEKKEGAAVSEDAIMAKEVEEFEERLEKDQAPDEDYLIREPWEVALKVCLHSSWTALPSHSFSCFCPASQVLSNRDEPELPSVTFRTIILGLGFSAFGA